MQNQELYIQFNVYQCNTRNLETSDTKLQLLYIYECIQCFWLSLQLSISSFQSSGTSFRRRRGKKTHIHKYISYTERLEVWKCSPGNSDKSNKHTLLMRQSNDTTTSVEVAWESIIRVYKWLILKLRTGRLSTSFNLNLGLSDEANIHCHQHNRHFLRLFTNDIAMVFSISTTR